MYLLTCACVDFFEAALLQVAELKGVQLHALHGRMKQAVREATLQAYTTQPAGLLSRDSPEKHTLTGIACFECIFDCHVICCLR